MRFHSLSVLIGVACLAAACSNSMPPPQPVAAAPPAAPPAKPSVESLTVEFADASAKLTPAALQQLDGAARLYRDAKPEVMIVSGHADTTGTEFSNLVLSARRAEAVKHGLADRGVPANRLQVVAIGEAQPVPGVVPARTAVITWR